MFSSFSVCKSFGFMSMFQDLYFLIRNHTAHPNNISLILKNGCYYFGYVSLWIWWPVFELLICNILSKFSIFCQDWLAFVEVGVQLTFQGKLQFENGGAPLEQDNFAFCKVKPLQCFSQSYRQVKRQFCCKCLTV